MWRESERIVQITPDKMVHTLGPIHLALSAVAMKFKTYSDGTTMYKSAEVDVEY